MSGDRTPHGDRMPGDRIPDGPRPDREAWARIQTVFHAALELEPGAREGFVRAECADRPEHVEQVLGLLEEDACGLGLLDKNVGDVADVVLDDSVPPLRTVGRYRLERVLGRGGMGVVYLAQRDDVGLKAAVKVLRDAALSPARRARFLSEQRTLAGLTHPRVAQLYDADLLPDDTPYFVMEYVEGEALDVHCARHDLTVRERLALFREVCETVQFAHGRAVIHRDLKPSNIMVTAEGEPKLLDFGIAKHLDADGTEPHVTRTELRMMTPAYAAPEQLLGEPLGVYTDVYALGVILYGLMAGRAPFDLDSLTPGQAEHTVLETRVPPPSSHRHDAEPPAAGTREKGARPADAHELSRSAWEDLDVLCAKAMHRDLTRRYASVEALARDVGHFLAGEPLEARPDSTSYRVAKFVRRNARAVAFVGAAVAGLVAIGGFYTLRLADARDQALAEAERTRRMQAFTTSLFQGGDGVAGPADTLRVLTLLERGVHEAGLLSGEPEPQSEMYLTLGTIYAQLGRFDRADSLLGVALDLRAGLEAVDERAVTEARVAIGELRIEEGRYAEAEDVLTDALAAQRAFRPRDELAVASTLKALGRALDGRGEYERAVALLQESIEILEERDGSDIELSGAVAALATTYFYVGDLDRSDSLNRRALEIDRRLHGDGHPTIADGLINLAASEVQRGRYVEAEELFREAVTIFEAYHGADHLQTASALRMLGNDLLFQARLDEAKPLLVRALEIQEQGLSPEHPRLANTMGDLAYVYLSEGRYDEAVRLYERIVGIYRTSNGERHYFVAIGMSNLANALMEGGRLRESEEMFRDVVARFAESRGADHSDTGIARIKLGRVLLRLDAAREAEAELMAGYKIVSVEAAPTVSWLRAARGDLVTVYEALAMPDRADHFRREQAALDSLEGGP